MANRFLRAGLLWPTVCLVPALGLLIALGAWQWGRMTAKTTLIATIDRRLAAPAVPLADALRAHRESADVAYLKVRARGRFDHTSERFVYRPAPDGGGGYHVYTRLLTDGGGLLLVNRGFVTDAVKDAARRPAGQIEGPTEVVGLVRLPQQPGAFDPPSDPARNLFFYADYAGMLGRPQDALKGELSPVPFFVDADATDNPGGWPKGGTTLVAISNRHLEYAVTWWAFALSLTGVYLVFARGRLQLTAEPALRQK